MIAATDLSLEQLTAFLLNQYDSSEANPLAALQRKDKGVYLTCDALADLVAELTLKPILERADRVSDLCTLRILDPAVGGGAFLLAAARLVRERIAELMPSASARRINSALTRVVRNGFAGIDVDPIAARLSDLALRLECVGHTADGSEPFCEIVTGDALNHAFHDNAQWDAIFCNPPWGKIKPSVREFYAAWGAFSSNSGSPRGPAPRRRDEVHEAAYEDYARETRQRARTLKTSGTFNLQYHADGRRTGGDAEYYRFFLDRIYAISRPHTRLGLIVPIAFLNTEGATGLRRAYLSNGTFEHLLSFENRRRLFAIHGMYRFTVAIYQRGVAKSTQNVAFALTTVDEARASLNSKNSLSRQFIERFSPYYSIVPAVKTSRERRLIDKLRSAYPALRDENGRWGASFIRECDMTNDSHLFVHIDKLRAKKPLKDGSITSGRYRYLALYEGRLIDQFDSMAKKYISGEGRRAIWEELKYSEKELRPHFYICEDHALDLIDREALRPRAGYCEISGHANERTVLAALIPEGAICGNKVHTLRFRSGGLTKDLIWIGIANSVVIDWVVRRLVSTTINYFYWDHVPFPYLDDTSAVGRKIAAMVRELVEPARIPARECDTHLRRRAALRAVIDGIICHAFGLSSAEIRLILDDFPLLDAQAKQSPTKTLIIKAFNELTHSGVDRTLASVLSASKQTVTPGYVRQSL